MSAPVQPGGTLTQLFVVMVLVIFLGFMTSLDQMSIMQGCSSFSLGYIVYISILRKAKIELVVSFTLFFVLLGGHLSDYRTAFFVDIVFAIFFLMVFTSAFKRTDFNMKYASFSILVVFHQLTIGLDHELNFASFIVHVLLSILSIPFLYSVVLYLLKVGDFVRPVAAAHPGQLISRVRGG